jgi:hypothetical protein
MVTEKKLLLALALVAILAVGTAFADHSNNKLGIGIASGIGLTSGYNAALSLHVPNTPIFWAIKIDGFGSALSLSITGDIYLFDQLITNWLHWYLGIGGYGHIGLGNPSELAVGGRLPVGLSFHPIPLLELFIEASAGIGLGILPDPVYLHKGLGGAFGIRLWL